MVTTNVELEELPKPSCAGAAALLIAAALTFLPVRQMPPLSIKEQLQVDRQHIRQSLLAATPHMDMGQGWGRSQARASELQWHTQHVPVWVSKVTSEKKELHSSPKAHASFKRRNPTNYYPYTLLPKRVLQ